MEDGRRSGKGTSFHPGSVMGSRPRGVGWLFAGAASPVLWDFPFLRSAEI